jgi:RNA polymerase sigma-70 factor (ECF subfamily)
MSTGNEPSDAELLCQVSRRNAEALELLYERHARLVFDFICQIIGPGTAACDILTETFYSLWREANEERGLPRVKVYLLHAAHQQCCRHLEAVHAPAAFQTIAYAPAQAIT